MTDDAAAYIWVDESSKGDALIGGYNLFKLRAGADGPVIAQVYAKGDYLQLNAWQTLFDPPVSVVHGKVKEGRPVEPEATHEAWALIDPNWGDPKPVVSTIRATEADALEAAITCAEASLYSGASIYAIPPRKGRWEPLAEQGFTISRVRIVI